LLQGAFGEAFERCLGSIPAIGMPSSTYPAIRIAEVADARRSEEAGAGMAARAPTTSETERLLHFVGAIPDMP